jgi:hypothetical protein
MVANFNPHLEKDGQVVQRAFTQASCQASIVNISFPLRGCSGNALNELNDNQIYAHDKKVNKFKYA